MKFLTLIRHAKSSRDNPLLADHLRPLNPRGNRDAPAMGKYLDATFRFAPDRIISSPATRALATARLIGESIGYNEWQISQEERIYEAPVGALLEVVREMPDTHSHVCLVGHNPGMENFTNWLCGTRVVSGVTTCAVIMLEFDTASWGTVAAGKARLREYIYPELIGLRKDEK